MSCGFRASIATNDSILSRQARLKIDSTLAMVYRLPPGRKMTPSEIAIGQVIKAYRLYPGAGEMAA